MKREFKPCVYCNTVTNHSFHFSHLELLLNVQKGKSNVPVDPSLHCLHRQKVLFHTTPYIYACRYHRAPQAGIHRRNFETTLKWRWSNAKTLIKCWDNVVWLYNPFSEQKQVKNSNYHLMDIIQGPSKESSDNEIVQYKPQWAYGAKMTSIWCHHVIYVYTTSV